MESQSPKRPRATRTVSAERKSADRMSSPTGNYRGAKIFTVLLLLFLLLQAFHHRAYFSDIPEKPPTKMVKKVTRPSPDTVLANPLPVPLPSKAPHTENGLWSRLQAYFRKAPAIDERDTLYWNQVMDSFYTSLGVVPKQIRRKVRKDTLLIIDDQIKVPKGRPILEHLLAMKRLATAKGYRISAGFERLKDSTYLLELSGKTGLIRTVRLKNDDALFQPGYARLAIVLEDLGPEASPEADKLLSTIRTPITLGIVPLRPQTDHYRTLAEKIGFEILCQLPMESVPFKPLGPKAIYKHFDKPRLKKMIVELDQSIPEAKGFSIYGGGLRIMENEPEQLQQIFKHIKESNRYFVDNSFSQRSRALTYAPPLALSCMNAMAVVDPTSDTTDAEIFFQKQLKIIRKTGKGILLFRHPGVAAVLLPKLQSELDAQKIRVVPLSVLFK